MLSEAADVKGMRRSAQDALCGADGIVLRQAQGRGHIVRGPHGDIAHRRRIRDLHQPRQHLAEGAVTADTGDHVVARGFVPGDASCLSRPRRKKDIRLQSAPGQDLQSFSEVIPEAAAACRRIHDQQEFFHGFLLKSPRGA